MVMQQEGRRPYAAPANVLAVLERIRTRNLPDVVDHRLFGLAGVPDTVNGRVTQTLQFLDLVHEDGRPTDKLRAMAGAPEVQFKELLAESIRAAYRDDFVRIDPGQDTQGRIIDAFRIYEPRSQTDRMVMLLLGLCRAAGIPVLDAPRERKMQTTNARPNATQNNAARKRRAPKNGRITDPVDGGSNNNHRNDIPQNAGLLLGISVDDIGLLDDNEFAEVWGALGKVARARARAKDRARQEALAAVQADTDDTEDEDE